MGQQASVGGKWRRMLARVWGGWQIGWVASGVVSDFGN